MDLFGQPRDEEVGKFNLAGFKTNTNHPYHNPEQGKKEARTIPDFIPEVFFVGQIVCGSKFSPSE